MVTVSYQSLSRDLERAFDAFVHEGPKRTETYRYLGRHRLYFCGLLFW
jgi:hypothetical protein